MSSIFHRVSIRKYKSQQVEPDKIEQMRLVWGLCGWALHRIKREWMRCVTCCIFRKTCMHLHLCRVAIRQRRERRKIGLM